MKKFTFMMAAVAAILMCACNGAPTAKLHDGVDTFSYAFGFEQGKELKQHISMNLGIDTTLVGDVLRGILAGAKADEDSTEMAYMEGWQIGRMIANRWVKSLNYDVTGNDSTDFVSLHNILAGMCDAVERDTSILAFDGTREIFEEYMRRFKIEFLMEQYGGNKKAGEEFMAEVAKREGVNVLENGVLYEIIKQGKGVIPADTSRIEVNYVGTLADGTEFDRNRGKEPHRARANQFIPGFANALTHMPVGSKWKVYIPQDQAYGERQMGKIKPFSVLVFEIELVSANKK